MYDITKRESFSNVENWIENVNDSLGNNNDYLIVLMGNKLDLVKDNPGARDVTEDEAQKLCQERLLEISQKENQELFVAEHI